MATTTLVVERSTKARLKSRMPDAKDFDEAINRLLDQTQYEKVPEEVMRVIRHRDETFEPASADESERSYRKFLAREAKVRSSRRRG